MRPQSRRLARRRRGRRRSAYRRAMSPDRSGQDKRSEVVDGVTIKYHASGLTV